MASADFVAAQNLLKLIEQLIWEKQYEGVELLFTSASECQRNFRYIGQIGNDLLQDVVLQHLTHENYNENAPLYNCASNLLQICASNAPPDELLLELLHLVEENDSEYIFTSALRAMQVVLLRLGESKPRALEWGLLSIQVRLSKMPMPKCLEAGYNEKQRHLLEQDERIQSLLMHYITIGIFYEPLLEEMKPNLNGHTKATQSTAFRDSGFTRCNVLLCFLISLLGKPLALLDLSGDEISLQRKCNTHTLQVAHNVTKAATLCIGDPFRLLAILEQRVRWSREIDTTKGVDKRSASNIFLIHDKLPLDALAIYFYMVLVEGISAEAIPKVYAPSYVFEAGLYLVTELLSQNDYSPLQYRGVLLMQKLLDQLRTNEIPAISLELEIHNQFCQCLCTMAILPNDFQKRKLSYLVLCKYIRQFEDTGKYQLITNLIQFQHNGLAGQMCQMYKDLVRDAMVRTPDTLPAVYSGQLFKTILLQQICNLPDGGETDLLEQKDRIVNALNVVRFMAIYDVGNRTGIWDFVGEIEHDFLKPLRTAIDMSVAHNKERLQGDNVSESERLKLMSLNIANSICDAALTEEEKVKILNQNLTDFQLIDLLLAHTNESLEATANKRHNLQQQQQQQQKQANSGN